MSINEKSVRRIVAPQRLPQATRLAIQSGYNLTPADVQRVEEASAEFQFRKGLRPMVKWSKKEDRLVETGRFVTVVEIWRLAHTDENGEPVDAYKAGTWDEFAMDASLALSGFHMLKSAQACFPIKGVGMDGKACMRENRVLNLRKEYNAACDLYATTREAVIASAEMLPAFLDLAEKRTIFGKDYDVYIAYKSSLPEGEESEEGYLTNDEGLNPAEEEIEKSDMADAGLALFDEIESDDIPDL